ncbi:hypothetical protein ACS0PU_012067 [Formica fusca]
MSHVFATIVEKLQKIKKNLNLSHSSFFCFYDLYVSIGHHCVIPSLYFKPPTDTHVTMAFRRCPLICTDSTRVLFSVSRYQPCNCVQWRTYFQDHLCCPTSKVDQRNNISLVSCYAFFPLAISPSIYIHMHIYHYTESSRAIEQTDVQRHSRTRLRACADRVRCVPRVCGYQRGSHH